jgi:septal ring-binding cell division protein DamX
MLTACAGPKMAQDLQSGKSSFENGYYKEAFRQLLPLAAMGKAEAQYAVGYMYYYGYGIPEDCESGVFWMMKAAEQNYPPAVKALLVLKHPTPEYESMIPVRQPSSYETYRDQVLHEQNEIIPYIPPQPQKMSELEQKNVSLDPPVEIAKTEPQTKMSAAPATKVASSEEEKQLLHAAEQSQKYALQLYGSFHLDSVKNLQAQLQLKNTGHIYQTKHEGKDWYVLTFGNFPSAHEASATQKNLPDELKGLHPWVRDVNALERV